MKVRLKHVPEIQLADTLASFNSMKVRLKRNSFVCTLWKHYLFQFHEGPIKTLLSRRQQFQIRCFNSMKVRLKLC